MSFWVLLVRFLTVQTMSREKPVTSEKFTTKNKKQRKTQIQKWRCILFPSFLLHFQVKAAAPGPVGGAAAGVFEERGAAAGQAAVPVSERGSGLLVWPGLPADQPTHHHLEGAEEDRLGRARPVVKQRMDQNRIWENTENIKIIEIIISQRALC